MFVLPYKKQLTVSGVPWVTLALVWVCLWMFLLQRHDDERVAVAYQAYAQSSLAQLETDRYRIWLQNRSDGPSMARLIALDASLGGPAVALIAAQSIQANPEFLRELRSGAVIKLDDPVYARWREDRLRFEGLLKQSLGERLQLRADTGQPWRLLTYALVHTSLLSVLLNMLVLFVAGAYAEHALGRGRFLAAYLLTAAASGGTHLVLNGTPLAGATGAVLATTLWVALYYRKRIVPTLFTAWKWHVRLPVPAAALLPIGLALALMQLNLGRGEAASYSSLVGALIMGALLARLMHPRPQALPENNDKPHTDDAQAQRRHTLARQAREAVMRMDTRRAVRLYRELVDDNPDHSGYLASYFNAALMAHDPEMLSDAALRVLWMRNKGSADELRKIYLLMAQPYVLRTLPVDEQLRLARRLVRTREDAAALKVLDSVLDSPQLRHLYGRQIADCLLGLFTTYTRYGLRSQAASVRARLKLYFPQPGTLGGLAPSTRGPGTRGLSPAAGPGTLHSSPSHSAGPSTLYIDLS